VEQTLFWIGCGLGGYALVLRQIFKKEALLSRRFFVSMLHVLFWAAVGALVGYVISASVDLQGTTARYPLVLGLVGFLWGLYQATRTASIGEGPPQLLAEDLELVETSFSAVLLAALIMYAVVQAFKIPSASMENTLLIGDHLFVNKFIYGIRVPYTGKRFLKLRDVHHGDVVVFQCPEAALSFADRENSVHKDFIKRAVGLPGDVVMVKNKQLYVNGVRQVEAYTRHSDPMSYPAPPASYKQENYQHAWESGELAQKNWIRDNFGPVTVPPNDYFVMGDNRDGSFDSRFWGPVPNRLLKGKAWLLYWPLSRVKVIH
jgi:signal peptidase I